MDLGGTLPLNTHGGLLSYAHPGACSGMLHYIEAIRQLRGEAGDRQVADCEMALVSTASAVASNFSVTVLGPANLRTRMRIPEPLPASPGTPRRFWASAEAHEPEAAALRALQRFRFYPSEACHFCASLESEWVPITGRAEVYTYTVLHRGTRRAVRRPPADRSSPGRARRRADAHVEPRRRRARRRCASACPSTMAYEDVNDEVTLPVFRAAG